MELNTKQMETVGRDRDMKQLCQNLLSEWSYSLRRLQIRGTGNPRLDGGILCPACGRIHGRCFEAMYPFLYMAAETHDNTWLKAAKNLFYWAENTVSQKDGSYLNDIDSDWKGTTVFAVIQLADCLLLQRDILPLRTFRLWEKRLRLAADFLYSFEELNENNINYPIANALAMFKTGQVFDDFRYKRRAQELAAYADRAITARGLLFGEGVPRDRISPGGYHPLDVGYNVEETLPALALYSVLSQDEKAKTLAEQGLLTHLQFMLPDGAWDNSFGTRNFKWTYWGSRTTDGCALGYLLFSEEHQEFVPAVYQNLQQLKQCTVNGMLAGGPHYADANQPICIHHTFTHAKVLAEILDRSLADNVAAGNEIRYLPRRIEDGISHLPELGVWRLKSDMTATITAYDWEYLPGGQVSGGTLSLLHHRTIGPLLCAGMSRYYLKEPGNMQIPTGLIHECLALRVEFNQGDILYSSLYETSAQVKVKNNEIVVSGELKDIRYQKAAEQDLSYQFHYRMEKNIMHITVSAAAGVLICPLISRGHEVVQIQSDQKGLTIQKETGYMQFHSSQPLSLPYQKERIFNLVPGFQALRVDMQLEEEPIIISISALCK